VIIFNVIAFLFLGVPKNLHIRTSKRLLELFL